MNWLRLVARDRIICSFFDKLGKNWFIYKIEILGCLSTGSEEKTPPFSIDVPSGISYHSDTRSSKQELHVHQSDPNPRFFAKSTQGRPSRYPYPSKPSSKGSPIPGHPIFDPKPPPGNPPKTSILGQFFIQKSSARLVYLTSSAHPSQKGKNWDFWSKNPKLAWALPRA